MAVAHDGLVLLQAFDRHVVAFEPQRQLVREACGDEVLDHLRLPVDHHRAAAGQLAHRDVVEGVVEAQVDAAVEQALLVHPLAHAGLAQHLHGALFEHAGADPRLDVLPAARLEDDRVDAMAVHQLPEQQAGRTGTDDRHLGSLGHHHPGNLSRCLVA